MHMKDYGINILNLELKMFDWKKPTAQMLGRWQPWHDGHTALFEKITSRNRASNYYGT